MSLLFRLATSSRFESAVRALPPTSIRARRAADRYVAGESFADARRTTERLAADGVAASIDQFGELVDDRADAHAVAHFSLATHDGVLRESLLAALGPVPIEQLLGVRPEVAEQLVTRGVPVRVYVPFGDQWFRYWMRRVAESRGA